MKTSFHNQSLQNIHNNAEKLISTHLTKLDGVSNDIKALEAILSKSGISVTFQYLFEICYEKRRKRISYMDLPDQYIDIRVEINHYIVWDREKHRLLYEIHETEREVVDASVQSYRKWGPYTRCSKPLIETKTNIRLKVSSELEPFYNEIVKLFGKGHLEDRISVESPELIPF